MRLSIPTLLFLATCLSRAFAADIVFQDHPLTEVKASVQIPEGWTSTQEEEDGVFVYHFGKAEKNGKTTFVTLSVTTKVPDRTGQSPAEYAEALIDLSKDDESPVPVMKSEKEGMAMIRCEYDIESEDGQSRAVNISLANDKTGTLYFFAWQAPLDESVEKEAIREKILATAKFDPAF